MYYKDFLMNKNLQLLLALTLLNTTYVTCSDGDYIGHRRAIAARNAHKITTLHDACLYGDVEKAEELIAAGHSVNTINNYGYTPLRLAIEHNNVAIVQLLINHKVDIRQTNEHGQDPLDLALTAKHRPIIHALIAADAPLDEKKIKAVEWTMSDIANKMQKLLARK